jgi:hypothetical protein
MNKLKIIRKTLELLKRYDYQIAKTARKTGIKSRAIKSWYDKQKMGLPLLKNTRNKRSKFSKKMRKDGSIKSKVEKGGKRKLTI